MPNMDRTGPTGTGPIGRGRGGCQQTRGSSDFAGGGFGRCRGQGRGRGFGGGQGLWRGNGMGQGSLAREDETVGLKKRIDALQARLEDLEGK